MTEFSAGAVYMRLMLSVVLLTCDPARPFPSPEAVVRTLTALIPGAIEGLVRDVVLAARPADPDLRRIADHAGCDIIEGGPQDLLAKAFAAAREPLVLVLLAGEIPGEGFIDEMADLLAEGGTSAVVRRRPEGVLGNLLARFAPVSGILGSKNELAQGTPTLFAQLVRRNRSAPTLNVRTRHLR
jgi:hypothetical protein